MNRRPWLLYTTMAFGYAFLYIPIVSVIVFSFNKSRLVTVWGGYQAYCEGLKRLEISRVGVLITFEPFIAAFFSWLWWQWPSS